MWRRSTSKPSTKRLRSRLVCRWRMRFGAGISMRHPASDVSVRWGRLRSFGVRRCCANRDESSKVLMGIRRHALCLLRPCGLAVTSASKRVNNKLFNKINGLYKPVTPLCATTGFRLIVPGHRLRGGQRCLDCSSHRHSKMPRWGHCNTSAAVGTARSNSRSRRSRC